MKKRRAVYGVLVIMVGVLLMAGSVKADDSLNGLTAEELVSILKNAVPGSSDVTFSVEQESSDLFPLVDVPWNVVPIQYSTSTVEDAEADFDPAPTSDFSIGIDSFAMNTFVAVANHDVGTPTPGIMVIHLLKGIGQSPTEYWLQDIPDWGAERGDKWRFSIFFRDGAPDMPGNYAYIGIIQTDDQDCLPYNRNAVFGPVRLIP